MTALQPQPREDLAEGCSAKAVANYFLDAAERDGKTLNPMKIQKLVYIAHGWHLALRERPLIHESAEARDYGPVIGDLYREFARFGNGPITARATEVEGIRNPGGIMSADISIKKPTVDECSDKPDDTRRFLDRVWEVYSGFTAVQLANMTHEPGTPWDETRKLHPDKFSVSIPDEVIGAYYRAKISDRGRC